MSDNPLMHLGKQALDTALVDSEIQQDLAEQTNEIMQTLAAQTATLAQGKINLSAEYVRQGTAHNAEANQALDDLMAARAHMSEISKVPLPVRNLLALLGNSEYSTVGAESRMEEAETRAAIAAQRLQTLKNTHEVQNATIEAQIKGHTAAADARIKGITALRDARKSRVETTKTVFDIAGDMADQNRADVKLNLARNADARDGTRLTLEEQKAERERTRFGLDRTEQVQRIGFAKTAEARAAATHETSMEQAALNQKAAALTLMERTSAYALSAMSSADLEKVANGGKAITEIVDGIQVVITPHAAKHEGFRRQTVQLNYANAVRENQAGDLEAQQQSVTAIMDSMTLPELRDVAKNNYQLPAQAAGQDGTPALPAIAFPPGEIDKRIKTLYEQAPTKMFTRDAAAQNAMEADIAVAQTQMRNLLRINNGSLPSTLATKNNELMRLYQTYMGPSGVMDPEAVKVLGSKATEVKAGVDEHLKTFPEEQRPFVKAMLEGGEGANPSAEAAINALLAVPGRTTVQTLDTTKVFGIAWEQGQSAMVKRLKEATSSELPPGVELGSPASIVAMMKQAGKTLTKDQEAALVTQDMWLAYRTVRKRDFLDFSLKTLPSGATASEIASGVAPQFLPPEKVDELRRLFTLPGGGVGYKEGFQSLALIPDPTTGQLGRPLSKTLTEHMKNPATLRAYETYLERSHGLGAGQNSTMAAHAFKHGILGGDLMAHMQQDMQEHWKEVETYMQEYAVRKTVEADAEARDYVGAMLGDSGFRLPVGGASGARGLRGFDSPETIKPMSVSKAREMIMAVQKSYEDRGISPSPQANAVIARLAPWTMPNTAATQP